MAITELGTERPGVGTLYLDDDCDWSLRLPPLGSPVWPDGSTAWIRFYESDGTMILQLDADVSEEAIAFSMQSDGTPKPADIPDGSLFKIRVSLPGDPTTEAPLWKGGVIKETVGHATQ